ncbi:MAG: tRNA (N6-threonylcarbamoyladenosine(37)-N6)-methyltransferase TrmO [Elusimicrobia bacterium]|nr:tRNA (N6-threonylcarbamoyladenosine(37)-N6)-methyltransferase TrmO [Elusimicrobiota bacterium]
MKAAMIKPVGYVRSGVKSRGGMGLGGSPAVVEVLPRYAKAMLGLREQSHVWILGWLHRADRSILRARPRKISASLRERGVFAMRSPDRPNPLALTCARLLEVRGRRLYLSALDMIDGTPVADIKSYSPGIDSVPCAAAPDFSGKYALLSDENLARTLMRLLQNHFLDLRPGHLAAGALVFKYIRETGQAPAMAGKALAVRGGNDCTVAVEALFGFGARCRRLDGAGYALSVRSGKANAAVSCSAADVRRFKILSGY